MRTATGPTLLVAAASLAVLTAADAALGPRYGDELTIALAPFGSTEPRAGHTAAERVAVGLVHETLVGLDRDGAPRPSLAGAWVSSADGREWSFSLDSHARFHDDTPVSAAAAVASLRRFLRSDSSAAESLAAALEGGAAFRSHHASELPGLFSVEERRLVLRLSRPSCVLLQALTSPAAAVAGGNGHGAGPFAAVLDVPGRRLLARAHQGHVRGRPFLDRVLLIAGPPTDRADARFADAGEPRTAATLLLALDASRAPFESADARAAVDASIDRADLAGRLIAGGSPRFGLLEQPGSAPVPPLAARRLQGSITLAVEDAVPPLVSQRIVAWLTSLGLRAAVRVVSGAAARRAGASARLFLFLPEVNDPVLVLREALGFVGAKDTLGDSLDASDAEPDAARRRGLLRELEQRLLAEKTLLPLASLPLGIAARAGVHGIRFDAAGRLVLEDAWREPR